MIKSYKGALILGIVCSLLFYGAAFYILTKATTIIDTIFIFVLVLIGLRFQIEVGNLINQYNESKGNKNK